MQKQMIWLSYDLGVDGDYENLYAWLDNHEARECGDSVAAFSYEYSSEVESEIKRELKEHVNLRKNDRIYLVFKYAESKIKGKFLFGGRKKAPWAGYAIEKQDDLEDSL